MFDPINLVPSFRMPMLLFIYNCYSVQHFVSGKISH